MTNTATPPLAFTLAQRVAVYGSFGSFDMTGTVVKLPRPNGLLRDPMVSIELDVPNAGGASVISVDPRRVAPEFDCETCRLGCDCDGATGTPGCGHYACWGRADGCTAPRCPGADIGRARSAAYLYARRQGR